MGISPEASLILLLIFLTVGAIVFLADLVIFIRWISYRWAKYEIEDKQIRLGVEQLRPEPLTDNAAPDVANSPYYPSTDNADLAVADPMYFPSSEIAEPAASEPPYVPSTENAVPAVAEPPYYPQPDYPFARTWSLVDPFLVFQIVFVGIQVVSLVALLPIMLKPTGPDPSAIFSTPGIIVQLISLVLMNALLVAAVAFCVHRYGLKMADIGLGKPVPTLIGLGIMLGLVVFVSVTAGEWAMGIVLPKLLPKSVFDAMAEFTKAVTASGMFDTINSVPIKVAFALVGAIAAPIGEEVFFRGLLYNSLKRRLNVPAAIVLSGLLFALVHVGPLAIFLIFPMGMFLAYIYEKTKSLWVTISIHATHNGLSFALAMAAPHLGEAPKEPIKPAAPPSRPAIVWQAPAHPYLKARPVRNGVAIHG